ncbi:MAG: 30S ribosomal protein S9 [Parcubacteria group bacterium CG11_big_fil_rev_8_21_14_0_20_39_14]|nr:MAG: 30S ribosomal protein S9 [Parcubacteria group bacterium CG11_big_fil_rev_8_21_14_0_20_39_14]
MEKEVKKVKKEKKGEDKKGDRPSDKKEILVNKKKAPTSAKTAVGEEKTVAKKEKAKLAPEKKKKKIASKKPFLPKPPKYWEAVGGRKTSVARIRLFTKGEKAILVNNKDYKVYFPGLELQQIIVSPLQKMKCFDRFSASIKVKGGGIHSQAEAIRHGIARALVKFNPDFRKRLRKTGYLTRDPRMKERKKFGLKRARRAPQWRKR